MLAGVNLNTDLGGLSLGSIAESLSDGVTSTASIVMTLNTGDVVRLHREPRQRYRGPDPPQGQPVVELRLAPHHPQQQPVVHQPPVLPHQRPEPLPPKRPNII